MLRNRLGIVRKREMDLVEAKALDHAIEAYLTRHITQETRFTAKLICQMHHDWLGSVYPWAGTYRKVTLSKGYFTWPPSHLVPALMKEFESGSLKDHTPCTPGSLRETAAKLAEVHSELLMINPFREGNGRLARWLADLMALQAGYPRPLWSLSGRGSSARKATYLGGVSRGAQRDYQPLTDFFEGALEAALGRAD